ncbi:MAG: hypothetical protein KatS3mg113_0404 [Planctomycetaceae bacterium]|nr:MAG: hypothetical protein KatS3mg113_0404 [Planctomycetaceae bacterium]
MGLSIQFEWSGSLDSRQAREVVELLHEVAQRLPFRGVGRIREVRPKTLNNSPPTTRQRLLIEAGSQLCKQRIDGGTETWVVVPPRHALGFAIKVAAGAESLMVGLASHPAECDYDFHGRQYRVATHLDGRYSWLASCKTQYAALPHFGGEQNFLRAHLGLIALLDVAATLGLRVMVIDQGGYWEHRDEARLLAELAAHNQIVAAIAGIFKDLAPEDGSVMSPIFDHPAFEHLEAQGHLRLFGPDHH